MLAALVLGSTFAAIPLLLDASKRLISECQDLPRSHNDDGQHHAELMLPMVYNLAGAGKFLSQVLVVFAGWFYGAPPRRGAFSAYCAPRAREHFPEVGLVYLPSERDYFDGKTGPVGGLVTTAESGSAWTWKNAWRFGCS